MRIELSCRLAGSVGGRDAPNVRGAPLPSIDSLTGAKQRPTLRLKVMDDGALQLRGDLDLIRVVDGNGHPFDFRGRRTVLLCRCGRSRNKPFCDSSHERIEFKSVVRADREPNDDGGQDDAQ